MNISKEDRDVALKLLAKIMYATSENSYVKLYDEFCSTVSASVRACYDENWHTIKSEWVRGLMIESNFMNDTNNRNQNLNGKIKLFCDKLNFLADFVNEFLTFVMDIDQHERNIKATDNFCKVLAYKLTKDQQLYFDYVTRYAVDLIEKEISEITYVKNFIVKNQEMSVLTKFDIFKYLVTPLSCTCKYFISMGLPCRDIFKFREHLGLFLFDERLVLMRWTNKYFSNHRIFHENDSITEDMTVDNDKGSKLNTIDEVEIISTVNEDAQIETSQSSVDNCNNAIKNEIDLDVENIAVVKRSNRKGRCKGSNLTAFGIPKKNSSSLCNNTVTLTHIYNK